MKRWLVLPCLLLFASCATLTVGRLVGTWNNGAPGDKGISLRLRSDGKGYMNSGGSANFVRWELETSNVVIRIVPEKEGKMFVGQIDPESDALILVSQDNDVIWLYHVGDKEPPDLEAKLSAEAAAKAGLPAPTATGSSLPAGRSVPSGSGSHR